MSESAYKSHLGNELHYFRFLEQNSIKKQKEQGCHYLEKIIKNLLVKTTCQLMQPLKSLLNTCSIIQPSQIEIGRKVYVVLFYLNKRSGYSQMAAKLQYQKLVYCILSRQHEIAAGDGFFFGLWVTIIGQLYLFTYFRCLKKECSSRRNNVTFRKLIIFHLAVLLRCIDLAILTILDFTNKN